MISIPLTEELEKFHSFLTRSKPFMIGYPGNLNNDFSELQKFFDFIINNAGDPSGEGAYRMHSKAYEKCVLRFFSDIYNFDPKSFWGYLTFGSTEANLMGLLMGRIKYPKGVMIFSKKSHYSVVKNSIILNIPFKEIGSSINGEIDYEDMHLKLSSEKRVPIINLTIGTTIDGAIDSVDRTLSILKETSHKKFYIHCDAALFGGYLPFLGTYHELDFRKPIDSISISAHKFFGVPFPSGIFLSKQKPDKGFVKHVSYIEAEDTTISGSRCGQLALFLWALIKHKGKNGFKEEGLTCIENAKYLHKQLQKINYEPRLNDYSNTVTFKKPRNRVINKWQLATEENMVTKIIRAHVVVMQHVTKKMIDSLIHDIVEVDKLI